MQHGQFCVVMVLRKTFILFLFSAGVYPFVSVTDYFFTLNELVLLSSGRLSVSANTYLSIMREKNKNKTAVSSLLLNDYLLPKCSFSTTIAKLFTLHSHTSLYGNLPFQTLPQHFNDLQKIFSKLDTKER